MEAAEILRSARTIAVYGLSATPGKPAHDIPMRLAMDGYTVVGINPAVTSVEGIRCYASLDEVEEQIDILNVFRRSEVCDAIVDEAITRARRRGDPQCVWLQSGITTAEGALRCAAAGLRYVEDTCIYVVHQVYLR